MRMNQQRGVSLIGLLFWGVVVAFVAVVAARVFPTVLEFYTIQKIVDRIAVSNPATVPAVRAEFRARHPGGIFDHQRFRAGSDDYERQRQAANLFCLR